MATKSKKAAGVQFYTWGHNVEGCLRNGSFVKRHADGALVQYMNGDMMGILPEVPVKMVEVSAALAADLLPQCCRT